MKYVNPIIINNVPNVLFFLNSFPFIYLLPTYIPNPDITKDIKERKIKGRRVNILTPDPRPKGIRKIDNMIVDIKMNIEEIRMVNPTVLVLN